MNLLNENKEYEILKKNIKEYSENNLTVNINL